MKHYNLTKQIFNILGETFPDIIHFPFNGLELRAMWVSFPFVYVCFDYDNEFYDFSLDLSDDEKSYILKVLKNKTYETI